MKPLTPAEVAQVQSTLALARQGRATLAQLAAAHDLASRAGLDGTLGELGEHMRRMIPPPRLHDSSKHIALGVISGLLTHYILRE
jgi:hypothetical protein